MIDAAFLPSAYRPPVRHPDNELLLDYAAGASSAAEAMMIATHLVCCGACRDLLRVAEQVGGVLLDEIAPARLPVDMLNRTLTAIDAAGETADAIDAARPSRNLDSYLAAPGWKKIPGGFRMLRVSPDDGSGDARIWLFDAPPGMKLLPHRHNGDEWTVILRGLLVDNETQYRPGDFVHRDDGTTHGPTVGGDERCVCLIMVRESPRYTTLLGRVSAPFVRL